MNHQMPLEDRERYEALRSLLENPGWALLNDHFTQAIKSLEETILEQCSADDLDALRQVRMIYKNLINWPAEQRAAIEGRNKPTERHG